MKLDNVNLFPLGDSALTVSFGSEISPKLNDKALLVADYLDKNPFPGFCETVPAYCSVSVFYDVLKVRSRFCEFPTAFEAVAEIVRNAVAKLQLSKKPNPREIQIPVNFGEEFSLDLEFIAAEKKLSREKIIEIFISRSYRVYFLGFLPGFAYMGEVDEQIAVGRKSAPQKKIAKGSVGIAGRQTGIYPCDSPGGWQIIGKTDVELFTPDKSSPTFLRAGDLVRFTRIN